MQDPIALVAVVAVTIMFSFWLLRFKFFKNAGIVFKGLNYGIDVYPKYSSDADNVLRAGADIRHCVIGVGVSASHGYERSHIDGLANTFELVKSYIELE